MADPLKATLPGLGLSLAWLNTSLASGEDDSQPLLYRTVLVEVYRTGVQLVATDSFLLLGAFAPTSAADLTSAPSVDESPIASYVVQDPDKRARALMAFVLTEAKAADKESRPFDVTIEIGTDEDPVVPTLDPTLDRSMFVISTDRERLALPIYEAEYLSWRHFLAKREPAPADHTNLTTGVLASLGKIKAAPGALRFDFDGPAGMIQVACPGHEAYVFGGLMPANDNV